MFVRPIPLVKIDIVCSLICSAQSFCVLSAQTRIRIALRSGNRSIPELDIVQPLVLFSKQICKFHISHPQKAKGPAAAHQFRQELGLGHAGIVAILLFTKRASARRWATLQQLFVISHFCLSSNACPLIRQSLHCERYTPETRVIACGFLLEISKLFGNPVDLLLQRPRTGGLSSFFLESDRSHASANRAKGAAKVGGDLLAGAIAIDLMSPGLL